MWNFAYIFTKPLVHVVGISVGIVADYVDKVSVSVVDYADTMSV